jgi:hypothetical protein
MWITRFASNTLPTVMPVQDIGLGRIEPGTVQLPGGRVHDAHGDDDAPVSLPYRIAVSAEVFGTGSTSLRTNINEIRALQGERGLLVRKQTPTAAERETVTARMEQFEQRRDSDHIQYAPIRLTFLVLAHPWSGTSHTVSTAFNTSGTLSLICNNGGNAAVDDAVLTVTAEGTKMTGMTVKVTGATDLRWAGDLATDAALELDMGGATVTNDGTDAYDELTIGADHAQTTWLRLEPGNTTITITRTGAENSSVVSVVYRDGWA